MTNFEKITKDIDFITIVIESQYEFNRCNYCIHKDDFDCRYNDCREGIKAWLEREEEISRFKTT